MANVTVIYQKDEITGLTLPAPTEAEQRAWKIDERARPMVQELVDQWSLMLISAEELMEGIEATLLLVDATL